MHIKKIKITLTKFRLLAIMAFFYAGLFSIAFSPLVDAAVPRGYVFVYDSRDVSKIKAEISGAGTLPNGSGISNTKIYAGEDISKDKNKKAVIDFVSKTGSTLLYRTKLTCQINGKPVKTFITISFNLPSNFDTKNSFSATKNVVNYLGSVPAAENLAVLTSGEAAQYSQTPDGDFGKKQSSSCLSTSAVPTQTITLRNYQKLDVGTKQAWAKANTSSADRNELSGNSTGGSGQDQPDCDAKLNSPLSWVLCPVVDLGAAFTDFVFDTFVKGLLSEVPISTDPDDGGYLAWQNFRILANIMLVGTLLAIVYGQVRGDR